MQGASDDIRQAATHIIERFDSKDSRLARQCLVTSSPEYLRAWSKMAVSKGHTLTPAEQRAMNEVEQFRAMSLTDSAGGYLALLVGMDPERLKPHGLSLAHVAGIAQVSGQVFNHYTVREERGQARYGITADAAAPAFHIRKSLPPILTLYAQNDMLSRAEENMLFVTTLKLSLIHL